MNATEFMEAFKITQRKEEVPERSAYYFCIFGGHYFIYQLPLLPSEQIHLHTTAFSCSLLQKISSTFELFEL